MNESIKFIFFDLGNVFVTYDHVFDTVKKDLGLDEEFFKSYDKYDDDAMLGKLFMPDIWQKVCRENGRPDDAKYDIIKSWVSDYEPIIPMHKFAMTLNQKYNLGILSNLYIGFWEEIVKQNFVPNDVKFSPVIISAEVSCQKPDPAIYRLAEEQSGFKGSEIFFIDDKQENLDTATTFCWQTFLFDYNNPQSSADSLAKILL